MPIIRSTRTGRRPRTVRTIRTVRSIRTVRAGGRAASAASVTVLALLAALAPAHVSTAGTGTGGGGGNTGQPSPVQSLQRDADALRDAGVTGVSVRLETPAGVRTVRSGVGNLRTGTPVPRDGYLRIGSTTKTYVATVLLQLAGEGRLSLDDTVEQWLPEVVRGHGNDGRRITLRHLLQHTSGLPEYVQDVVPDLSAAGYHEHRGTTYTSEQRVAFAMTHPPSFAPGAGWEYSNTNYILAGLVIEAVTGRSWDREVHARILRPLGLTRTVTPGDDPSLPRPHARNYQQFEPAGPMTDTTLAYLPFDGDADGSVLATAADTNAFFRALLGGRLLAPAQLAELRRTIALPDRPGEVPGSRDGLGIFRTPLSCGGGYWGHSGSSFGALAFPAVTDDGRTAITVSAHSRPGDEETAVRQLRGITDLIDHALCATG
ncbi:serine hydrolase domain-containing protein [Streptomyces beigongshangae]|uniref:serine hydrolase domain-containing protein n=1 Tax=Streptomyces beigongshangae TaxID=2841597 RepID=UPI001C8526D1|nr:serine hydrolase domain-containing protein [Streptomyces sp. REN17]